MIAVASLIPNDPDEQRTVLSVLDAHPEVRSFVASASAKAEELFPGATTRLDSVPYDEWDPPLQLVVSVPLPWTDYLARREAFITWVSGQRDLDLDLILPLPMWTGPLDSRP